MLSNIQKKDFRVIIIGSGFSGLCAAIKLKKLQIPFVLLEKAKSIGGTWWFNQYPGCACDIQSILYSFSFEPYPYWKTAYPSHDEVLKYLEYCVKKYDLTSHIHLNTKVVDACWNEDKNRWQVLTENGKEFSGNVLISGIGGLHDPRFPDIPHREEYTGKTLHTSAWDHTFDAKGKTVAVIGTGASAIQVIPELAKTAEKLLVFQRTPPWVAPRDGVYPGPTTRKLFKLFPKIMNLWRWRIYWRNELFFFLVFSKQKPVKEWHQNVHKKVKEDCDPAKVVKDPILQKIMRPDYPVGCKRVLVSNDYYATFNLPHVRLISEPINQLYRGGIMAGKVLYDADAVVYATGFIPFFGYDFIRGKDGRSLANQDQKVPNAYYGMCDSNHPNLFMLLGPGTGLGHTSVVWMIECQVNYVIQCIERLLLTDFKTIQVKKTAQEKWYQMNQSKLSDRIWSRKNCRSWYQTEDGVVYTNWHGHTFQYWWETLKPRFDDFICA